MRVQTIWDDEKKYDPTPTGRRERKKREKREKKKRKKREKKKSRGVGAYHTHPNMYTSEQEIYEKYLERVSLIVSVMLELFNDTLLTCHLHPASTLHPDDLVL